MRKVTNLKEIELARYFSIPVVRTHQSVDLPSDFILCNDRGLWDEEKQLHSLVALL